MKDIEMCVKDRFHFAKYHEDIECRIVKTTRDRRSGLLKLYRNGVELPTRRNIWIDFVIINNKDTRYQCAKMLEINGKAYDVVICDDKGVVYYNGALKRERQTYCAKKYGQPIPEDTIEIQQYYENKRNTQSETENIEHLNGWDYIPERTRTFVESFVTRHPDWFGKPFSEMTNKDIYDAYWFIRNDVGYGN